MMRTKRTTKKTAAGKTKTEILSMVVDKTENTVVGWLIRADDDGYEILLQQTLRLLPGTRLRIS